MASAAQRKQSHPVDPGIITALERTKTRLDYAIEEYRKAELPLISVEFNIRQSILALRDIRKSILHGGYYG